MDQHDIRVVEATTLNEIRSALRLRYIVYSEIMPSVISNSPAGLEITGFDLLESTTIFLAYSGSDLAGTTRLIVESSDLPDATTLSARIPLGFTFSYSKVPNGTKIGELGRTAVLRGTRGSPVVGELYRALYEKSVRNNLDYWFGLVLTETNNYQDASIMVAMMRHYGVKDSNIRATPIRPSGQPAVCTRPFYSDIERNSSISNIGLKLSSAAKFNISAGVELCGDIYYLADGDEYVIPVIVSIADFPTTRLGRRLCL